MPTIFTMAMLVVVPGPQEARSFPQIRSDVRAALRTDIVAESGTEKCQAIIGLTRIYQEIKRDARLPSSDFLEGHRVRLRARLIQRRDELKRQPSKRSSAQGRRPQRASAAGSGGGAAMPDYGPRLVALIERTIAPDFWDVHGGPGSITYYRPLRVLVVRATDDVHGQVGGLVGALRK